MNTYYQDQYCKVTDLCLIINKYYFPLATSRTILYTDIEKITLQSCINVRHKWGLSTHWLNNWFHYDGKRRGKEYFIAVHIKGRRIVPSLTPEDAKKVFDILRQLFMPKAVNKEEKANQQQMKKQEKGLNQPQIEEIQQKQMDEVHYKQDVDQLGEQKPSEIELIDK